MTMGQTTVSSCPAGAQDEAVSSEQIVKVAINVAFSYHETRLAHLQALQDGGKPRVFNKLVEAYEAFLAQNEQPENAFVTLLQFISR